MESLRPIENTRISPLRLFADLQVCSTYRSIKKALEKIQIRGGTLLTSAAEIRLTGFC